MNTFNSATLLQHAHMILDAINDEVVTEGNLEDLHQDVFNSSEFIIGYHAASEWIKENFNDAFEAIEIVKDYEISNFGEFNTEINSEKIAGMLSYICGEEVISELDCDSLEELKDSLTDYIKDLEV